ncbi:MAG: hypothetical protein IEMM0001_1264 [bacterium]|nr:MAG: hypothetical protein IEMM0001_1264 [bacterium]
MDGNAGERGKGKGKTKDKGLKMKNQKLETWNLAPVTKI